MNGYTMLTVAILAFFAAIVIGVIQQPVTDKQTQDYSIECIKAGGTMDYSFGKAKCNK